MSISRPSRNNLDPRDMAKNKTTIENTETAVPDGYLTLKEAADLTEYSPDYIGQLIRAGKLEGKQIYSNISWVTSENSLKNYLAAKGKEVNPALQSTTVLPEVVRPLLYLVIAASVLFMIILAHVLSVTIDKAITSLYVDHSTKNAGTL